MGKANEGSNPTNDEDEGTVDCSCCSACASSVCTITTLKWVVAVAVCVNLLVFTVLSLPISGKGNVRPASGKHPQAQIQASFRLHKPVSAVNANIPNLESAIWEEIGIPYTKVTVISVEPLNAPNFTEVIFGVLPDPENSSISTYGLISLKETFIALLSESYNISLASEALGFGYFFQMLKFPGGITVIPKQRFFPLQPNQVLFNFTLHSTVAQVVQNLAQMKNQLKIGLFVQSNENLFVRLTNLQGSTVDPPIIVETFIVPVVGKGLTLTPPRLRQLAHEITPARNLGLNHTLFGKVKQIQLSSYLRYPSTPPAYHVPSPAPDPAASPSHYSLCSPSYTHPSPSIPPSQGQRAMVPSPHYSHLTPIHHHPRGQRTMAPSPHDSGLTPIHHHHHAMSPSHHHSAMPPYHHRVGAPSYHRPLVHCDWHHASDPSKCGHRHVKPAPISGLNGVPGEVDPSSRFTVQEAVNSLATAYKDCNELVSKGLEALLLENSQVVESEARFCAVRWATTLYGLDHCPSRFICMLRAADTKLDIREMALEGLFPQKQVDRTVNQSSQSVPENYPPLKQMLDYISKYQPQVLEVSEIGESKLLFPPKMYVAMIRFLQKCYDAECGQASLDAKGDSPQHVESVILLCLLLEHAMAYEGSVELHATASKGLLNVASQNPQMIASRYAERLPWLKQFLGHIDSDTRESISRLLGITCSALSISSASVLIQELCSTFKVLNKGRFEDSHGAICVTGYVVAQCMTGMPSVARELLETSVMVLVDTIKSQTLPLAGAAAEALGHVGLRGHLSDFGQDYQFHNFSGAADMEPLTKGIHEVKTSTKEVSGSISSLIERMKELLGSNDTKVVQKVVIAFGHICHGDTSPRLMDMALDSLFSLSRSKVEDVLFSAGEALAFIWGGVPVSVDEILKSGYTSLSTSSNYLTGEITQHGFIDSMVVETEVVDNGRAKAREKIAKKLFDDLLYSNRKEERCTGSVWLLSLTTYCGQHPKIQELLPAIQEAFSHLLAEQNELTQEMASRGMSIVYDLGNSNTKSELVQALVGTLTGTAKRKHVVKMTEDSEVFEEGSIGERPGGEKLSTYKELCSLATDMGQPDLIYKFMDLANYQASLNSKRGAAFGFSKIAKQAGNALKPHLHSLVPKLVRYQYDPDKNIREAMENIWRSLMADPKKTIDEFFDDVIVDLLTQSGSRLWRSRESSCLALSDLLQGRKFDQVGKYLERVWIIAFRAMDDIKESVRNSGDSLCRAATSLSLRLCDTSLTERSDASATMAIVLPFMLSNGIMSKVATVQKVSINLVMKLAKAAGDAIRPHLPELVFCMLESLSSLEDQRLNYAELHAESVGIQKEKFENLRIAAAKDSPMWETLDLCLKHVDPPTLELLVPRLVQLVRSGVGLNTRVGVARFISFLVQNVGSDIKPFINSLVKILFLAVEREKSSAAKKAFAAACGGLLKYAGSAQAQKMIEDTIALYTSGGDKGTQVASAILLKTFSHQAADIVKGYHTIVLPVVFMARFDDEKDISSLFEEVWEENSSSESVTLQLYLPEIVAVLCDTMLSSSWASKKKSAKAVIMLAETLGESLAPFVQDLLKFLVKEVPGRIWEGKEVVLDATAALCQACHKEISADDPVGPDMLVTLVSSACTKKRKSYREAAFLNLEKIIKAFGKPEFCNMVMPFLLESCSQKYPGKVNQSGSSLDGASAEENGDLPPPLGKVLDCITSIITVAKLPDILEHGKNMIAAFLNSLRPELSWQVKLSAFSAIRAFYGRLRVAASQAVSISSQQAAVQQTLITESFQSLSPLILECISSIKIAQVHLAACECLVGMVEVFCPAQKIDSSLYKELLQLYNVEKNESAKSVMKKSLDMLEDSFKDTMHD